MYCTVTTTDSGGASIADAQIVGEEMETWLRDLEGFEGFVLLAGEDRALGLAFWATREVAERYAAVRSEFRAPQPTPLAHVGDEGSYLRDVVPGILAAAGG